MRKRLIILLLWVIPLKTFAQCESDYSWVTWGNFTGNNATGSVLTNGNTINVSLTANYNFGSTNDITDLAANFSSFQDYANIPNAKVPMTSWSIGIGGRTTICFSEPVTNPILLLASLGRAITPVTISFTEPYLPVYDGGGMVFLDPFRLTGIEGNSIIMFPGTFTCITINSTTSEYFTNLTWGIKPPLFPINITNDTPGCGTAKLTASGGISYQWSGGLTPNKATNTITTSGVYAVTAKNANNCLEQTLKEVILTPNSFIPVNMNESICGGESFYGYTESGTYIDTLSASTGCDTLRTILLEVIDLPVITFNQKEICDGNPLLLQPTLLPLNQTYVYKWSTGENSRNITITRPDNYELTIENGTCSTKESVNITRSSIPILSQNEIKCLNTTDVLLEAGTSTPNLKYLWSPGSSTNPTLSVKDTGSYEVKVSTLGGCEATKTFTVIASCTPIIVSPNAFTPNNDGVNDEYSIQLINADALDLSIYNRWGESIYQDSMMSWDGKHLGKYCPAGVYNYILRYITPFDKKTHLQKGHITLIR